jgi:hypothetical protein
MKIATSDLDGSLTISRTAKSKASVAAFVLAIVGTLATMALHRPVELLLENIEQGEVDELLTICVITACAIALWAFGTRADSRSKSGVAA